MKIKLPLFVFFVFMLLISRTQARNSGGNLRQKLQAKLDRWHKNGKFAGATLGVCFADGSCFSLATGFSDAETRRKMYFPDKKISIAVQVNSSVPTNLGKPLSRISVESAEIVFKENVFQQ